ncbi:MAG TPA: PRC-barrel domain-containing protein [Thermoanaerobaculia bacterium]|nr:PRC-barrel domain-containing protein [Thermoanaerobaculia bacterium]
MQRPSGHAVPARSLRSSSLAGPDVRGWTVVAADGEPVGRVHDLLVDEGSQKALFLDVEVAPALTAGHRRRDMGLPLNEANLPDPARAEPVHRLHDVNPGSGEVYPTGEEPHPRVHSFESPEESLHHGDPGNHVLIPVGLALLKEDEDHVVLDSLRGTDVQDLPSYADGPVLPEMEMELRRHFQRGAAGELDLYDEERFFSARRRVESRR